MAAIELDAFLPHPPAEVWRALTDRELLARWLMPNDFVPRVGHRFTFDRGLPGPAGEVACEVLELEREELLRIRWRGQRASGEQMLDTTVTWRLVPEGRGTRLFLTHDGFDDSDPAQRAILERMGGGWRGEVLASLRDVLAAVARG